MPSCSDSTLPNATKPSLQLTDYDFPLPRHLVARYPLAERDHSRMMTLDKATGAIGHRHFTDFLEFVQPGDLVVLNNTQVLPSRFFGHRKGHTGKVEIFLLHPDSTNESTSNHLTSPTWQALMRPAKKLKPGTIIELPGTETTIEIRSQEARGKGQVQIHLKGFNTIDDFMTAIGHMPIPPYLEREAEPSDQTTYQTVYAKVPGAQAAPTAGLHFTQAMFEALKAKQVNLAELTLSVSSGTFRDVESLDITHHKMDPEHYTLNASVAQQINQTKANGGRIIAIGTTVAKTLETIAQKYPNDPIQADTGWSHLFIYPEFQFQVVDALLTNFHLPKTTLLMLVSAFSKREFILNAYTQAVENEYRFFSYGDCMLITGEAGPN